MALMSRFFPSLHLLLNLHDWFIYLGRFSFNVRYNFISENCTLWSNLQLTEIELPAHRLWSDQYLIKKLGSQPLSVAITPDGCAFLISK